jgi:DNA-binding transcriptional ArsR family regulator
MPQTRIQGKFYPLQHEEFLKLNKRLTQSELAVYLWLKTNDPFGDKLIEASTKQIADDLNVSRRTIQRALVKLRDENLIDLIITKFQYRVKSHPAENASEKKVKETLRVATPGSPSDTSVAIGTRMSPSVQECRHRYENVAIGTGMSPPTAETQSEQKLENPKTLQTYSDFKDSLSEDERENFFNFVQEKISNLERPINDLEAWLASENKAKQNRWEIYYRSYQEEQINEGRKTTRHSENGGKLSPSKMQQAIAEFQKQRQINQPVDEPENANSDGRLFNGNLPTQARLAQNTTEEYHHSAAEINELLDNPPERFESLAQTHREAARFGYESSHPKAAARIAEVKRQQAKIRRANREAAESRAKQQNLDPEPRKLETLRQIEEMNQLQSSQNSDLNKEDGSNE